MPAVRRQLRRAGRHGRLCGYLPEYLYKLGALRGADSLQEYRQRGRYTERARDAASSLPYSQRIRIGVPGIGDN